MPVLLVVLLLIPSAAAQDEPPEAPQNFQGEMTADGDLMLSWDPALGDVLGYRIYENGALVDEVTELSWLTPPPTVGAYAVSAYNYFGESMSSQVVLVGSVGSSQNSCIILLPPIIQPSACEELVFETIDWVLGLLPWAYPSRTLWTPPMHLDS